MIDAGDIVIVDFRGAVGREQSGARPALVLSDRDYHDVSSTAVVMPITSNQAPWPYKIRLPDGAGVIGAVLVDQVKSVDRGSRGFRPIGRADSQTLAAVRLRLATFLSLREDSAT